MADRESSAVSRRRRAATVVLPALILLAGIVAHLSLVAAGKRTERERLDRRAQQVAFSLQRRVRSYGDVLYSVKGLFRGSEHVTQREFHENLSSQHLFRRHPGVQVVGYAEWAAGAGVGRLAARVGREATASGLGYPGFAVRPVPTRSPQAPVTYIEPAAGNTAAFGFDFMSEPQRRTALLSTLESDKPEATAPVRLVQETEDQVGFLVMLGVKRLDGTPHGAAYAAFRMGDLVRGTSGLRRGDELEVYDRGADGADMAPLEELRPAFDSDGGRDAGGDDAPNGSRHVEVDVMGRCWTVYYAPAAGLQTGVETTLEWLALVLAALLAAVCAWMLGSAQRTERRALALAERMTEHLRRSKTELARSNAELERFAYVASHDLREPLRTVTGFLGLLSRRHRDRLDDEGREFVDLAVDGAKRMDGLIAELLEYSRVGRRETEPAAVDVSAAWGVAVRNLGAAIAESSAEVTAGPLPVVLADRRRDGPGAAEPARQRDQVPRRGRAADPRSTRSGAARSGSSRCADNGLGIDPRHHDRIFVLLHRLHRRDEFRAPASASPSARRSSSATAGASGSRARRATARASSSRSPRRRARRPRRAKPSRCERRDARRSRARRRPGSRRRSPPAAASPRVRPASGRTPPRRPRRTCVTLTSRASVKIAPSARLRDGLWASTAFERAALRRADEDEVGALARRQVAHRRRGRAGSAPARVAR